MTTRLQPRFNGNQLLESRVAGGYLAAVGSERAYDAHSFVAIRQGFQPCDAVSQSLGTYVIRDNSYVLQGGDQAIVRQPVAAQQGMTNVTGDFALAPSAFSTYQAKNAVVHAFPTDQPMLLADSRLTQTRGSPAYQIISSSASSASPQAPASSGPARTAGTQGNYQMVTMRKNLDGAKEQESDALERLPDGNHVHQDPMTDAVRLVSLGCSCGPKLSFKELGRGAETLPFDWLRTTSRGVLNFLSTGFQGFFDFRSKINASLEQNGKRKDVPAFLASGHSFWHDDPTSEDMQTKYRRRIERFSQIDATAQPVLFVRSVASSQEIPESDKIMRQLMRSFGQQAKLLVIVDFQENDAETGARRVDGLDNLLMYFNNTAKAESRAAPYTLPIKVALDWAVGRPIPARSFRNLQEAHASARETDWGMFGLDGCPAFVDVGYQP